MTGIPVQPEPWPPTRLSLAEELDARMGDPFDLLATVMPECPVRVTDWLDFADCGFAQVLSDTYAVIMGDGGFEVDSPLYDMFYATFCEGWRRAVWKTAYLLAADKEALADFVGDVDSWGALSPNELAAMLYAPGTPEPSQGPAPITGEAQEAETGAERRAEPILAASHSILNPNGETK